MRGVDRPRRAPVGCYSMNAPGSAVAPAVAAPTDTLLNGSCRSAADGLRVRLAGRAFEKRRHAVRGRLLDVRREHHGLDSRHAARTRCVLGVKILGEEVAETRCFQQMRQLHLVPTDVAVDGPWRQAG